VGWVSLGPREEFAKLERSPVMKPVDEQPVWSVICFVLSAEHRGQRAAEALLEAYPVEEARRTQDENLWFGTKSMYDRAGFEEVARRKPRRPVVRLALARQRKAR
jgi:ribosomal protein S18 acetylase RimI-like enzyme